MGAKLKVGTYGFRPPIIVVNEGGREFHYYVGDSGQPI